MTPFGRAHCIRRLSSAKDLSELAKIWAGLGVFSQNDPEVRAHKDRLKAEFNGSSIGVGSELAR